MVSAMFAFLSSSPIAFAQQQPSPGYDHYMWSGGWHGLFFGPIMMIVFIAVAAIVVVLLVRWLGGPGHHGATHHPQGNKPFDILKERFARGEIDKEEYEERRRILGD
jgi:putative membrane protein